MRVLQRGDRIVDRARPDHDQQPVVPPVQDGGDRVPPGDDGGAQFGCQGQFVMQQGGRHQGCHFVDALVADRPDIRYGHGVFLLGRRAGPASPHPSRLLMRERQGRNPCRCRLSGWWRQPMAAPPGPEAGNTNHRYHRVTEGDGTLSAAPRQQHQNPP
jgi:hypothetical protein